MALEMVCRADFWCNRHCRTTPVILEGCWGQVWPKIGRKPEKSEFRVAENRKNQNSESMGAYFADTVSVAGAGPTHELADIRREQRSLGPDRGAQ